MSEMENAIAAACAEQGDEGLLVAKWAFVAEVIKPDGQRRLTILSSDSLASWEWVGMASVMFDHASESVQEGDE